MQVAPCIKSNGTECAIITKAKRSRLRTARLDYHYLAEMIRLKMETEEERLPYFSF